MRENAWRVARIGGVDIRVDTSWLVIALLIGYSFFLQFDTRFPGLAAVTTVVLSIVTAVLFFGSVLIHELAHALVSRARGIEVQDITLFLFGGATRAKVDSKDPKDEFLISVVGPLTSVVLAVVFWLIVQAVPLQGSATSRAIRMGIGYLGWINLILGIFNMLPGFPLDGGRVLRSIVWSATGSLAKATRIASRAGQTIGFLLIAVGVLQIFGGNLFGGLWMAAIGWFLAQAALGSYQQLRLRLLLGDVHAEDVMSPDLVTIPRGTSLQDAVDDYFMRHDHNAFPITDEDGTAVGLLTLSAVRKVARLEWPNVAVESAMSSLDDVPCVAPQSSMDDVLDDLAGGENTRVLVLDGEQVIGIITPRDLARWLRRSQELGLEGSRS